MTAVNPRDSRLHHRPPVYRTVRFAEHAYRVPHGCRIVGALDLGPDVALVVLRRSRGGAGTVWADTLVLRTFCCGPEDIWVETRSSIALPVRRARGLAKLIERVVGETGETP